MAEKIQTPELLVVYPNCIDGIDFRQADGTRTEKNYGMTFAIESEDPFVEQLDELLQKAVTEKFGIKPGTRDMQEVLFNNYPICKAEDHDTLSTVKRLEGMTLIKSKAKQPVYPVHIDDIETLIEDQEQIKTGTIGCAVLNPFAYTFARKEGVSIYLTAFCVTAQGPKFKVSMSDHNQLFKGIDKSKLKMSKAAKEEIADEIKNLM